MAERRMFAKTIIDSDAFLDMPIESQFLYFHLAMRADDDGFINKPKSIMRMCHCNDADLQALLEKKFLIQFENGIVVIKHWKIHNYIRKDTYTETKYKEEKSLLELDENNAYRLSVTSSSRSCDESVTSPSTQVREGKEREGQDSLGKGSVVEEESTATPTLAEISDYIHNNNLSVNPNRFFFYYDEREWKTTNGKPIKWQDKLHEWDFDDKQKAKANAKPETQMNSNPFLALAKEENLF